VFSWIATIDLSECQGRCRTGSGVSFGVIHGFILLWFLFGAESSLALLVSLLTSICHVVDDHSVILKEQGE
jgi:hypothetical protein